jgi:protein RecA
MVFQPDGGSLDRGLSSDGYVYDLTVEDNHNFVADGLLVSNSGKTFLLQLFMKTALDAGLQIVYIDTEQTFDPEWWAQVGLPLDGISVSQPTSGEAAVAVALAAVGAGVDIVAIDSLAALYPSKILEEDTDKKFPGYRAQMINRLCEGFLAQKSRSVLLCTNQLRDSMMAGPAPALTMPGGRGLLHYTSIILRMNREGWITEKGRRVGFFMRIQCHKSKVGTPFGECVLPFRFRGEIDMLAMLIDRAVEHGIIEQNGPWFKVEIADAEPIKAQGKSGIIEELRERPELLERMRLMMGEEPTNGKV